MNKIRKNFSQGRWEANSRLINAIHKNRKILKKYAERANTTYFLIRRSLNRYARNVTKLKLDEAIRRGYIISLAPRKDMK